MKAPITVITATIPGREESLLTTLRSVYAQTMPVTEHLISAHTPDERMGMIQYVEAKNAVLDSVKTEWTAVLNDDDHWLPRHVETTYHALNVADVIYTWDAGGTRPQGPDCVVNDWPQDLLIHILERGNFIDGNMLIRTELLRDLGGWPVEWVGGGQYEGGHYEGSPANFEDWELNLRLAHRGAKFFCVPERTWVYNAQGGRMSRRLGE